VSRATIISSLELTLPRNYRDDFLERVLLEDCRQAPVEPGMDKLLVAMRESAYVSVASDNMDCFAEAMPLVFSGRLAIDDLIVSADVGVLKTEDPDKFFGPTLLKFGLGPNAAILIDDSSDTCEAFREWGGCAIYFRSFEQAVQELAEIWPRSKGGPGTSLAPFG